MIISVKRVLLSIVLLALLMIGRDLTTHLPVSAQSFPLLMVWSADSRRLAVSIEAGALVIEEGKVISRCAVDGTVSALAFSSDGESLYVGTNEGEIMACNARTGRKPGLQQQTIPRPTPIAAFGISPDGNRFFVHSGQQAPNGLYLYDLSLTFLAEYNPMGFDIPIPTFLPDGTLLTFSREENVLTVERNGEPGVQITLPGPSQYMRVSSDGRYMLASTMDSDMLVFDLETGTQVSTFMQANFSMGMAGDYALLSGMNNNIVAVNLAMGERLGEWSWRIGDEGLLYIQNDLAVLFRQLPTDQPTLFRMDTGEMLQLNVGQKAYARIDFGLDDNLLLFGVTETGTDVITYPLSGTSVPALHPLTQRLSERVRTTGGHAFGFFDYQTLMVFDVNTGELLHEHAIPSFNYYDRFRERPDGNAYAMREDQTLTIRTLEGEESVITLPN
jgi:hypothetical protein